MAKFDYLLTDEDRQNALELAAQIASGTWIPFSGAGLSTACGLPSPAQLVDRIEALLSLEKDALDRKALPTSCSRLMHTLGRSQLEHFLVAELGTDGISPSPVHHRLLDLEPTEILTTNPEDLWEKTLNQRSIPYSVIVQAIDWSSVSSREQVPILKLHGDRRKPATLVFTEEDYSESIKDGILAGGLIERLARFSILFIGYSLGDHDLQRMMKLVSNQIGGKWRPHFIIQESVEDWRKQQLATQNIRVIQLGDYARMEQFLAELSSEAASRRPTPRTPPAALSIVAPPPLESTALIEVFQGRYGPAVSALQNWHLTEAEARLRELLTEIDRFAEKISIKDELRDFRQRVMMALAGIVHWRGQRKEALQLWRDANRLGPLNPDRHLQAAILLANLKETRDLEELLERDPNIPQRQKLLTILSWQQGKPEIAKSLISPDTDDTDLAILLARIELSSVREESALVAQDRIDRAWLLAEGSGPAMIEVASLTDSLLRRIVLEGWAVSKLDRKALIQTIRERYEGAISSMEALVEVFPEGLIAVLASAIVFHNFLDETERAGNLSKRLAQIRGLTRERTVAEYLIGARAADTETSRALFQQGFLTRAEWAILESRSLRSSSHYEHAEELLRDTLATSPVGTEREMVLKALLDLLLERNKVPEAEALLELEASIRPDLLAVMRGLIIVRTQGTETAVNFLRDQIGMFPRSTILLERAIEVLMAAARDESE